MQEISITLITLGALMMLGLVTDLLGRHTPLPRVTLLLTFGFIIGPAAMDLLPEIEPQLFELLSSIALMMIGFLIGGTLTRASFKRQGRRVLSVSIAMVVVTVTIVALWLDVSFILAAMVMGAVVTNLARHHKRPFHAIEGIEWPFLVLFFVLAGASLELEALWLAGPWLLGYVVLRVLGRLLGAWLGGALCHDDPAERWWMGLAMLPQAGVALGMALVAAQRLPALGEIVLPVIIGATVIFEVIGPVLTRAALHRVGERATITDSGNGDH